MFIFFVQIVRYICVSEVIHLLVLLWFSEISETKLFITVFNSNCMFFSQEVEF